MAPMKFQSEKMPIDRGCRQCEEVREEFRRRHHVQAAGEVQTDPNMEKVALQKAWLELDRQFGHVSQLKDTYQAKASSLEKDVSLLKEKIAFMQHDLDTTRATANDLGRRLDAESKSNGNVDKLKMEISRLKTDLKCAQSKRGEMEENYQRNLQEMTARLRSESKSSPGLEKLSRHEEDVAFLQEQFSSVESSYRDRVHVLLERFENERRANQRFIDQISELIQKNEDLTVRLRTTEEHLGQLRQDNRVLQEKAQATGAKLQLSQQASDVLSSNMSDAKSKIEAHKREKECVEKLYHDYKEKAELELLQKDGKIAQQEKLITHLQCQMASRKKLCCKPQEKKGAGGMTMADLQKTLDLERGKTVQLANDVRRLQQQLAEKRARAPPFEEIIPSEITTKTTVTTSEISETGMPA